tara:strand:- start:98 stop:901 length:804 start_codon:yes stop_codon:yes gene_type:complete
MKKQWLKRSVRIFSRHPSHNGIRGKIMVPAHLLACVRFGSKTIWNKSDKFLNSPEAIGNSSNKELMKWCFTAEDVKTAFWWNSLQNLLEEEEISFPIIAKKKYGSRGRGMVKIDNQDQLDVFVVNNNSKSYIYEQFYNFSREYRLHVNASGCFYTCRKMLKSGISPDKRWFRNDSNSVWFIEDNEQFDKPVNWDAIVNECVKAMKAVGLDFGACDVKVQSATNKEGEKRNNPEFIIIEINSAPSFGEGTMEAYFKEIPLMLKQKYGE